MAPPAARGGSLTPRGCRRCPCAEPCVTAQEFGAEGGKEGPSCAAAGGGAGEPGCRALQDTGGCRRHPSTPRTLLSPWLAGGGRRGPPHPAERPRVLLPGRFKISKIIVVGDLSVGKTCLINR